MADPADIAGETLEHCLADAERRARGKSAPEHDARFDGRHCVEEDCGVEIPQARLDLGKVRCVDCVLMFEQRAAGRQRTIRVTK